MNVSSVLCCPPHRSLQHGNGARVGSRSRLFGAWNGCSQMTMVKVTRQSETSTPGSPEDGETIRKRGSSQSNRPHPVSRARRATRQHHPTQRPQRARKKDGISLDGPDDAQRKNQKRSKSASGRKSVPSAGRKKAASLRAQSPASSKESKRPASRRDGKRGDEKRKGTGGSRKEEGHPGAESADGRGKDLGEAGGPLVPRTLAAAKMVRTKAITRNLRLSIGKAAGADVAQGGQGQQAPDAPQGFSGEGAAETRLRVARVLGLEPLTRSPNEGQGTGLPGRAKSAETRAKMSAAKRALWKDGRPAEHCVAISNGLIRSHEERRVAQEFKRRQERVQPVVSQTRVHLVKEEAMVERMHLKEEIITWLDSFEASTGLRPSLEQVAGHNPDVYRKFIRLMRLTDLVRASGMQKIK